MSIIGHIDLDAFFASVEEREKPYLRGLPVVVGADPMGGKGRGVVATANYKAREYGIHSAMPISQAWRLSEWARRQGKTAVAFIAPRHRKYERASRDVFRIVRRFIRKMERVSVDEAYLDMTVLGTYARARALAKEMQRQILREAGLTATVGIGPDRMVAKIASGFRKPRGLTVITPQNAHSFLASLPVRDIPGVGPKSEAVLAKMGIKTISQLRPRKDDLRRLLGAHGMELWRKSQGLSSEGLREPEEAKSVGVHETFDTDTHSFRFVCAELTCMSEKILKRLSREGFSGFRTVVLTVRFSDFETKQRSVTSARPMGTKDDLESKAIKLLLPFFERKENPSRKALRLVGLRVEKLA